MTEHERVVHARDDEVGLQAIVAIHDTRLGPAVGGCRMWPYESEADALKDVLGLSRAMTYKCALAGLPFGGGKSVILGDPRRDKSEALLERFGCLVESLGGEYRVAEDVGIGTADVEVMARATRHVAGVVGGAHGSGDPSPFTALGVLEGVRVAVRRRLSRELSGVRVAIQGVGAVGLELCRALRGEGAELVASDTDEERARLAEERYAARIVPPEEIYDVDADVFAPCALGGILNDASIRRLSVSVVAGAANVQLAEPRHAEELHRRAILYAPDYVVNAGGVINGSGEILGRYDAAAARRDVRRIGNRLAEIFDRAASEDRSPAGVADTMAEEILKARSGQGSRRSPGW